MSDRGTRSAGIGTAALVVLGCVALLGNGLKGIVTSTVLVSEAQFAAFLGIAVERVALLMQTIVAGMVVALAVYPLVLRRISARTIALLACGLAVAAFAVFAAVALVDPMAWQRELAAYVCLTLGAAALAWLAPSAQALVLQWPSPSGRKVLTTVWTGATPAGFLAAPQLAKWLLPALGLGAYFLAFAALPLMLLALVAVTAAVSPSARAQDVNGGASQALVVAFVATVGAFELWSTLGSTVGYLAPSTLASLAILCATLAWLGGGFMRAKASAAPSDTHWLVAALFVLEIPTTGFFEAAFLFDRHMAAAFVADRATLAALAQVAGTLAAGLFAHHQPESEMRLRWVFAGLLLAGVVAYAFYPSVADPVFYLSTAMLTGMGAGGLTLLLCLRIVSGADRAPLLAALPSIAIMVGTECGLEILEVVYAAARAAGWATGPAYRALFIAQIAFAALVIALLAAARRSEPSAAPHG